MTRGRIISDMEWLIDRVSAPGPSDDASLSWKDRAELGQLHTELIFEHARRRMPYLAGVLDGIRKPHQEHRP